MKRLLPVALAALLSIAAVVVPTTFLETFDGTPPQPQDYQNPHNWDILVFGVSATEPNLAQHGPNCEAPGFPYTTTNTHPFSTAGQAVFICNGHLMTSPGLAGYGAVYMTPPAVADFSGGSATISWAMSTLRTSSRDWVYLTLTPFDEHHEMPYLNIDQHIPPHNIKIALGGVDTFQVFQDGGFQNSELGGQMDGVSWDDVFAANGTAQSPIRRDTFEVTLSRDHISLCMPNYQYRGVQPFCWARNIPLREPLDPAVWHDQATVQITHVVYNPEKSCETEAIASGQFDATTVNDSTGIVHNAYGDLHCPPNTWHWDNVTISPSVPYSVIASAPPDAATARGTPFTASFSSSAPAGAFLSFVSWGDTPQLRVSFDQGATWVPPHFQEATAFQHPEVGENIFMPIPAGQTSVMVRGAPGYWGTFSAYAFKIVSPPASAAPQPAVTPVPVVPAPPVVTLTPEPATLTPLPTAAPTDTPVPTLQPTATIAPTTAISTATAVSTPTPESSCTTLRFINGVPELVPCS